jgi:maleylacetoacetate isomerase
MVLYTYFRSSAAFRVRIALNLKGIEYEPRFVHLLRDGGEQHREDYRHLNPLGRVPTLIDAGHVLTQSIAIIEYLEEVYPSPALMPAEPKDRAFVRAIALTIVADTQPLQNLSVTRYLAESLTLPKRVIGAWLQHWIGNGMRVVEQLLGSASVQSDFCRGDFPTLADVCLIAQCVAARRFRVPMEDFPHIRRIEAQCLQLDAVKRAQAEAQPDFEP